MLIGQQVVTYISHHTYYILVNNLLVDLLEAVLTWNVLPYDIYLYSIII